MTYIIHKNEWWWGKSYTYITTDGKAMIELSIENDNPTQGAVQSLIVHESVRRKGIGTHLMHEVEHHARQLGLKQIYLAARKDTFLIPWYERLGFEVYDDNPDYSKGQTACLQKTFTKENNPEA